MKWFAIVNKEPRKAKINIHSEIAQPYWDDEDVVGAKKFIAALDALDVDEIELHINSPGGDVFEGTAIFQALRDHKAKVHVTVDGLAASIASVIAMAGDTITMPPSAMMMIHDPSGLVMGTAEDMLKMAEALEKVKTALVAAYTSRPNVNEAQVREWMSAETWLTAQEAISAGLADALGEDQPGVTAALPQRFWNCYKAAPARLKNTRHNQPRPADPPAPNKEKDTMDFKALTLENLISNRSDLVDAIRAKAAADERARILAVKAQALPGHDVLIEDLMFDGITDGPGAAAKIVAAEKAARAAVTGALRLDAPAPVPAAPAPEPAAKALDVDNNAPVEVRCKAQWDASKALRDEFGSDFKAFVAFTEQAEAGNVKILKKAE